MIRYAFCLLMLTCALTTLAKADPPTPRCLSQGGLIVDNLDRYEPSLLHIRFNKLRISFSSVYEA